ncbi:semaphorin-7A-like [Megalops cyprinoides]|uniref:semaphorin-7A-like n=1 Tax=Megalops cyprinoides TaxID=118141 RepID=UPI001864F952|nr:semaphorin-7A-like [Megalops cyprinoides]
MKLHTQLPLLVTWNLQLIVSLLAFKPRLIIQLDSAGCGRLRYSRPQKHTVPFHVEGSDDLYVGATNMVYRINLEDSRIVENFTLEVTGGQNCLESLCENIITVIVEFQDSLFVCGTNAQMPLCWKLYPQVGNQSGSVIKNRDGTGISPTVYTQNSISLSVDGDLYAATPLDSAGSSLQFRRKGGRRTSVWMYEKWVTDPTFISASWVRRVDDPDQEKIYVFFRERNSDSSAEADPWISRIGRVCKVDEGGSKRYFQNMWTSFLKARLMCGIPEESLYFNRLQGVYVQHANDWRRTRVYALFSSSWNSTAICTYTMGQIDKVFENSSFKGLYGEIPNPRPGMCVPDSRSLPQSTIKVIQSHPEMSDWIHSNHRHAPLYISTVNYTRIVVDRVLAADGRPHNVLFLATDQGMIHRVLEDGSTAFIISETHLSNQSACLQFMRLDSRKRKLLMGFADQIVQLDLQRCQDYNGSCADCVLARDPYCAWNGSACTTAVPGSIQNIADGTTNVCTQTGEDQSRHRALPSDPPAITYSVPLDVPFYLTCPVHSLHANYSWEHPAGSAPCPKTQSECLYLIPAVKEEDNGTYKCVSMERDYTRVLKSYQLRPSNTGSALRDSVSGLAVAVVSTLLNGALLSE